MFRSVGIAVVLGFTSAGVQAGSFTPLGDLAGGSFGGIAYGVSDDGSVVVGSGFSAVGGEAFRWTNSTGMVGLGGLVAGVGSSAYAVSADGSVVVGSSTGAYGGEAFRWTSSTGMVGLGGLDGYKAGSTGSNVSADGSVMVGTGYSNRSMWTGPEAFRWTESGGMVGLGDLDSASGGYSSGASGVSGDGNVVVGGGSATAGPRAFLWTSDGGMVNLGIDGSVAISSDGRAVVVSYVGNSRLTIDGQSTLLGEGFGVHAVSGDGSVVVGYAPNTSHTAEAFIWTSAEGTERLFDVLVANGATGLSGWTLGDALGVSRDGSWVVGYGVNPLGYQEAFLANISSVPVPASAWLFGGALGLLGMVRRRSVSLN